MDNYSLIDHPKDANTMPGRLKFLAQGIMKLVLGYYSISTIWLGFFLQYFSQSTAIPTTLYT